MAWLAGPTESRGNTVGGVQDPPGVHLLFPIQRVGDGEDPPSIVWFSAVVRYVVNYGMRGDSNCFTSSSCALTGELVKS